MSARLLILLALLSVVLRFTLAMGAETPPETQTAAPPEANPSSELLKLRDPFKRPSALGAGGAGGAGEGLKPTSALETLSIDQIKVVGIMTGPGAHRAMIQAADGRTFFVAENSKVGMRKGVVKKITADSVRIREKILNALGQEESVDTEIRLPAESRGQTASGGGP
ncbi:pilus assembly protein PilP [Bdellovibrionota bacterium FG-2]